MPKKKEIKESSSLVELCITALEEKQVSQLETYDVRGNSPITDYFIVGTVKNERQAKAAGQNLLRQLKNSGVRPFHADQVLDSSTWTVVDCIDVIVHLFTEAARDFYNIEELWKKSEE